MTKSRLAAFALFVFASVATAYSQLAPRDVTHLKPTDLERVRVGDKAPAFTLENMDGKRISLSDFLGKKKVVLVFYRGQW